MSNAPSQGYSRRVPAVQAHPCPEARTIAELRDVLRGLETLGVRISAARGARGCREAEAQLDRVTRQLRRLLAQLESELLPDRSQAADVPLTPREHEILGWIASGKSNAVIAEILGISRHTVDTYNRRIFRKLDAADRTTAAVKALHAGVLERR
ncbi:helix-turn-helix transcriptional regulator [Tropicimonas marinistellae]|uniref:helix-turn-helix transcriptional regulator n=1 Tax=Tropicimonas marinistellae TaxID=1739787 RepID=UPI000837176D|nr:helix-turn-helix transcriptional regulator [Tropicimonas marinistellae]